MAVIDKTYKSALQKVLKEGYEYEDPNRKGVYRKEIPSLSIRHEIEDGFPAITTKEVYFKGALNEMLFFMSGSTDIRNLWSRGVHFWDKDWANFQNLEEGEVKVLKEHHKQGRNLYGYRYKMGRIYPYQYRNFNGRIDQIQDVLDTLRSNPMSTGMVVNTWNPDDLDVMCLPPCHYGFQIVGRPLTLKERLDDKTDKIEVKEWNKRKKEGEESKSEYLTSLGARKYGFEIHWQQRSTDLFLGTPINIMYYAILAKVFERMSGHKAIAVVADLKKVHLYDNQWESAKEQVERDTDMYGNSTLEIANNVYLEGTMDEFLETYLEGDIQLKNYKSFEKLSVPMLAYNK